MPITTVPALVQLLQRYTLLDAAQLKELASVLPAYTDPRLLARELVQRGWLTPHQVNHLFQGKEKELLLGQYVVLDRIGSGGMGAVLKARHRRLKRIDALKVIRKEQLANPKAVQRFQQEAEAVARLKHSNIVAIYDANEDNGTHFLVMEYVAGTDLSQLVKRKGPLPVEQACECIRQAALGLQHAHERGLVHRDIKPANLMLDEQEHTIKVLDMGLARMLSAAESEESTGGLTQTGTIMGTPDYISPEQAMSSHDVDIRTDIYSLGCTLYFLLTGQPPFPGGELMNKLMKHRMKDAEAVEKLRPEVPPALAVVVRKMMAKEPADRYQTPAETALALEPFTAAVPAGTQRRTGFLARPADAVLAPDQTVTGPAAVPLSDDSAAALGYTPTNAATIGLEPAPATAPAWKTAARVVGSGLLWAGKFLVRQTPIVYRKARPFLATRTGQVTAGAGFLCFMVLIALVMFGGSSSTKDKTAKQSRPASDWPLDNLDPEEIKPVAQFDWPPKGLVGVLGGHRGRHWGTVKTVAFSPNGKLAASAGEDNLICLWDAETLEPRALLKGHTGAVLCLTFTPDSQRLLSGSADKTLRLWDVQSGKQLKNLDGTNSILSVSISSNGRRAVSGGADHVVRLWDLEGGKEIKRFEGHKGEVQTAVFSRDESQILSATSADKTIRVWNVDSSKELRFYPLPTFDDYGAFSWNRQWFLYRNTAAGPGVCLFDLGSGKETRIGPAGWVMNVTWDRSDRRALSIDQNSSSAFDLTDMQTGKVLRRFEGHTGRVWGFDFSPNGKRVLSGGQDRTVRLWDTDTGKEIRPMRGHTQGVASISFTPDGKRLISGGVDKTIRIWDLENGKEIQRMDGTQTSPKVLTSPEGQRVLSWGDNNVRIWDPTSGKELRRFEHTRGIICAAWSADGHNCISASRALEDFVKSWDVEGNKEMRCIKSSTSGLGAVCSIRFLPKIKSFVIAQHESTNQISRWNLETGQSDFEWRPVSVRLTSMEVSPDGTRLLTGSQDGSVRLWDPGGDFSTPLKSLSGHNAAIPALAFSPDGKEYAAASVTGRIIVWREGAADPVQDWQLPGGVAALAFSPDGRHLASANADGSIYIFRLSSAIASGSR